MDPKPIITLEVDYHPVGIIPVCVVQNGGFGMKGLGMWAGASFEYRGRQHTVWLEYEGDEFPFHVVRERVVLTLIFIDERRREGGAP